MMKLPKLLLAATLCLGTNLALAQSVSTTTSADVPNGAAVTGVTVATPPTSGMNAPAAASATGAVTVATPVSTPLAAPSVTSGTAASASTDPYVQKRVEDGAAKDEYKAKKSIAKEEYKEEKAEAKSAMKAEKRQSARERRAALAVQKKPAMPDSIN